MKKISTVGAVHKPPDDVCQGADVAMLNLAVMGVFELPLKIESLEVEQSRLHATLGDAAFYQQPGSNITAALARLKVLVA